jgi:lysozyme family protein
MITNSNEPVRFIRCLPLVLREEVLWKDPFVWSDVKHNFSHDAHDPGGATMCGITQREYDAFRKHNHLAVRPVQLLSEAEGHTIYYHSYWCPHSGSLPPGLDLSFFDSAVNEGSTEAIRILQFALGLANDGIWGPKTAAAVSTIAPGTAAACIRSFFTRRDQVYRQTKGFVYFGKDWLARVARIEQAALEIASGRPLPNSGGTTVAEASDQGSQGEGG